MNSKGIEEEGKCARFFTLVEDAHIWYGSITPVGNDWNNLCAQIKTMCSDVGI